ncbi:MULTISPECIES: hypothetical protein [Haloarcula]|uniref:Uncharacterized protein n=1 Tax=Haloarcula amylolytica JCM 13557 TaxID=1227452 RepID=M0KKM8_9EURY|nr:hypothetical protein [Haloarcula amylolytica]EMA21691.1 hypothetical protein C442_09532 [Haloarcula amylolytica JCM 13557]
MPAVTGLFLVIASLAVVAPLVLYALVRSEHDQRNEMDRETAERLARRDTDDDSRVR